MIPTLRSKPWLAWLIPHKKAGGSITQHVITLTTPGSSSVVIPAHSGNVTVEVWGAGAGGGSSADAFHAGPGGGGGAYAFNVGDYPAGSYSYVLGAGGAGNPGGGPTASDGGLSAFVADDVGTTLSVSAEQGYASGDGGSETIPAGNRGGFGGNQALLPTNGGGGGGSGSATAVGGDGGPGGVGSATGGTAGAGGGAGGNGGIVTDTGGHNGAFPGGGGGGCANSGDPGGNGANGQIKITYLA